MKATCKAKMCLKRAWTNAIDVPETWWARQGALYTIFKLLRDSGIQVYVVQYMPSEKNAGKSPISPNCGSSHITAFFSSVCIIVVLCASRKKADADWVGTKRAFSVQTRCFRKRYSGMDGPVGAWKEHAEKWISSRIVQPTLSGTTSSGPDKLITVMDPPQIMLLIVVTVLHPVEMVETTCMYVPILEYFFYAYVWNYVWLVILFLSPTTHGR